MNFGGLGAGFGRLGRGTDGLLPPLGHRFLVDTDGAYFIDADGAYLVEPI